MGCSISSERSNVKLAFAKGSRTQLPLRGPVRICLTIPASLTVRLCTDFDVSVLESATPFDPDGQMDEELSDMISDAIYDAENTNADIALQLCDALFDREDAIQHPIIPSFTHLIEGMQNTFHVVLDHKVPDDDEDPRLLLVEADEKLKKGRMFFHIHEPDEKLRKSVNGHWSVRQTIRDQRGES